MKAMRMMLWLVPAMLCVAAGTAAALDCSFAHAETLELAPARVEIDGEEVDVAEFGSATFAAREPGEGAAWLRLDDEGDITEVYFQRATESR